MSVLDAFGLEALGAMVLGAIAMAAVPGLFFDPASRYPAATCLAATQRSPLVRFPGAKQSRD